MNILVTGGAGYIGSHAAKRLLTDGHRVVVLDDLLTGRGNLAAARALETLPGARDRFSFVRADIADADAVRGALRTHACEGVLHFAALAYVRESVDLPLPYYVNNTAKALCLLDACVREGVTRFVFSSTCATYGQPAPELIPVREDCPQVPITPYGWSKLFVERALFDLTTSSARKGAPFAWCALRYFNVAGADRDGLLGEDHDPETHIIPTLLRAALGRRPDPVRLHDAPKGSTPDGTCIRDYIHVDDLVDAHVRALLALSPERHDAWAYNLGTGAPVSTIEVLRACERVTGTAIRVERAPAHPGDAAALHADASAIRRDLEWIPAVQSIDDMVASAWDWMRRHPDGYPDR